MCREVIRDFPPGCGPLSPPKREEIIIQEGLHQANVANMISSRKSTGTYRPRLRVSAVRDFPPFCGRNVRLMHCRGTYRPSLRVSAVRDFPPFCGRNVRLPHRRSVTTNGKMRSKVLTGEPVIHDISKGKERVPISAVNSFDRETPNSFKYIARMKYPGRRCRIPSKGCNCTDGCFGSWECLCLWKNDRGMPYDDYGAIVTRKRWVYECGITCKCPASCRNRVTQQGIQFRFQVFKTKDKGWGVRSTESIASGSFICEYTGELLTHEEAEKRIERDDYLFDLKDGDFVIDAGLMGNVGRFINHSCSPNLYAQNVYYDHEDKRIPHIMLFAAVDIPSMDELTYDYNYKVGQVFDKNGNMRKKACNCGSLKCKGRMY